MYEPVELDAERRLGKAGCLRTDHRDRCRQSRNVRAQLPGAADIDRSGSTLRRDCHSWRSSWHAASTGGRYAKGPAEEPSAAVAAPSSAHAAPSWRAGGFACTGRGSVQNRKAARFIAYRGHAVAHSLRRFALVEAIDRKSRSGESLRDRRCPARRNRCLSLDSECTRHGNRHFCRRNHSRTTARRRAASLAAA